MTSSSPGARPESGTRYGQGANRLARAHWSNCNCSTKTWHAIHFLLTGNPWEGEQPLRNAVLGGTPLGTTDVGYGPARFLSPTEVHAVAAALRTISIADIEARFDLNKLATADIYPASWEDAEEELDYIRPYYRELVDFFQRAAEADDAMLLYIN